MLLHACLIEYNTVPIHCSTGAQACVSCLLSLVQACKPNNLYNHRFASACGVVLITQYIANTTSFAPCCVGLFCSDALLAFKATPSGDITGAASKALASGWYTYWSVKASTVTSDDDAKIGVQASVTAGTVGACVEACDKDDRCAAVIMAGITAYSAQNDVITGCTKIKGVNEPPLTKRSLTHAVKANLH